MARLVLPDAQASQALGAALGLALAAARGDHGGLLPLLLSGPLGSGKTTLVRGLVSALPGAHAAEVSSPSFNIVNLYPTTPPVAHFDLYRVAGAAPDEFFDALDAKDVLVVAEWAENLPPAERPDEALHLAWTPVPSGRALEIKAWGKAAMALLESMAPQLNQWRKEPSQ